MVKTKKQNHFTKSSVKRWVDCPSSLRIKVDIPEPKSRYAKEGDKAHKVAFLDKTQNG